MKDEQTQFYIYGRTSYEKPLTFVTEMTVQTAVQEEALAELGTEEWIELIAIPPSALIHVIGEKADD
jgi:hypothetical protein